mgnify:CR=1 FL=1
MTMAACFACGGSIMAETERFCKGDDLALTLVNTNAHSFKAPDQFPRKLLQVFNIG